MCHLLSRIKPDLLMEETSHTAISLRRPSPPPNQDPESPTRSQGPPLLMYMGSRPNFGRYREHPSSCQPLSLPIEQQTLPRSCITRRRCRSKIQPLSASYDIPGCGIPRSAATGATKRTHHPACHPRRRGCYRRHVRIHALVTTTFAKTGSGPDTTAITTTLSPIDRGRGRITVDLAPSPPYSLGRRSSPPSPVVERTGSARRYPQTAAEGKE